MSKYPRFIRPYEMTEIPVRTLRGVRLLRPTPEMTAQILGVLGRSLAMFEIWLHAFTFLSNHGHLLFTSRNAEHYAAFVQHFLRNSARAIQAVTGWEGPVWAAAPRPVPVLDDISSVRRLKYVLSNGVKEGLVATPLEWPGASGTRSMLTGEPIETSWPSPSAAQLGPNLIRLTPLPCWQDLPAERQRDHVRAIVDEITAEGVVARAGRPCLGVPGLLAQDPFEPTKLERGFAPLAYAATESALNDYMQQRAAFIASYNSSAPKLRESPMPVPFPMGAFPPAHRFTREGT